jgi:hypothetical protein
MTTCDQCGVANPADIHTCGAGVQPAFDHNQSLESKLAAPVQEPIYQMQMMDGKWIDQAKQSYEYNKAHGHTVRIVYTTPPAAQPAPVQPVACFIGAKGSAFDAPETKRAYTYKEQPGNAVASKLGRACEAANKQRAGDNIDRGLGLLQELQKEGFGVFALGAEYTLAQPAPCTWTKSNDPHMPDTFSATCGVIWTFTDGGPTENGARFCPGCGAAVSVADPEPEEDLYDLAVKADNGGQP